MYLCHHNNFWISSWNSKKNLVESAINFYEHKSLILYFKRSFSRFSFLVELSGGFFIIITDLQTVNGQRENR